MGNWLSRLSNSSPLSNYLSSRKHGIVIGKLFCKLIKLLDQYNGHFTLITQIPYDPPDVLDDRGLNTFSRLIKYQHRWLGGKRPSNRKLLLLTAR